MYSNAIDASEYTTCEWYGHTYTIDDSSEVYDACVDCAEPRQELRWATDEQGEH